MQARDVMNTNVVTISLGHSVRHAAMAMLDNRISGLPVVADDGKLAGIITEGDLLRRAELGGQVLHAPDEGAAIDAATYVKSRSWRVSDVMSGDVAIVDEDTPVAVIARIMHQRGIKRIPVLRDGDIVGIVSRADLLRAIVTSEDEHTAMSDEAIKRAIETRLHADLGLSATATGATVENRHVALWGEVGSETERQAARVAAEGIHGISTVTNNMTVGG